MEMRPLGAGAPGPTLPLTMVTSLVSVAIRVDGFTSEARGRS